MQAQPSVYVRRKRRSVKRSSPDDHMEMVAVIDFLDEISYHARTNTLHSVHRNTIRNAADEYSQYLYSKITG